MTKVRIFFKNNSDKGKTLFQFSTTSNNQINLSYFAEVYLD
jgi:hypothetical protein